MSRANVVRKLKAANVVDMATGEIYDPETITPEKHLAERHADTLATRRELRRDTPMVYGASAVMPDP